MLRKAIRKLTRSSRHYGAADGGSAAIEFAMVSVPFFYMLGAVFEMGLMMFTEYTLQASVQESSRLIKTGQAEKAAMTSSAFKNEICNTAGIIINCLADATVYVDSKANFNTLQSSGPDDMTDIGPDSAATFNSGAPGGATTIIVTYDWEFVLPFMKFFGNIEGGSKRRLVGFAMFRNEPWS